MEKCAKSNNALNESALSGVLEGKVFFFFIEKINKIKQIPTPTGFLGSENDYHFHISILPILHLSSNLFVMG